MGEKNPMGFFSYFERFIHETFRNIIFYEMMNNYDILMRLVVFKKKTKNPMGFLNKFTKYNYHSLYHLL